MTRMSALISQLRFVETVTDEINILNNLLDAVCRNLQLSSDHEMVNSCDMAGIIPTDPVDHNHVMPSLSRHNFIMSDDAVDTELDYLISYAFERRFGWSESDCVSDAVHCRRLSVMRRSATIDTANMVAFVQEDLRFKTYINDNLDRFIAWLMRRPLSVALLTSFYKAISRAQTKAVVRSQTLIHVMEWLSTTANLHNDYFNYIKDLVVLGVTDIWSAIRNATVSRLGRVVQHFSLSNVDILFKELREICKDVRSPWQSIEGSLMGLSVVICQFQWVGLLSDPNPEQPIDTKQLAMSCMQYILKFGEVALKAFPEFISGHIKELVFSLLAHPQLSVRENAVKAFTMYISRCDFKEALLSLDTVVRQLSQNTTFIGQSVTDNTETYDFDVTLQPSFSFIDAYKAEGLLSLCVHLVKQIPPGCLLPHWPLYFSTFSLYLMHPASTVRQTASAIFKFIVAKDCSNPVLLKLIFHGLVSHWSPDMNTLTRDESQFQSADSSSRSRVSIEDLVGSKIGLDDSIKSSIYNSWQWREGRLLAYELLLQFLIKNHLLYTFGPSQPVMSPTAEFRVQSQPPSEGKPSRSLHRSFKAGCGVHRGEMKDSCGSIRRRVRSHSFSSFAARNTNEFIHSSFGAQRSVHLRLHCQCLNRTKDCATTTTNQADVRDADGRGRPDVSQPTAMFHVRHSIATSGLSIEELAHLRKTCAEATVVEEQPDEEVCNEPDVFRKRVDSVAGHTSLHSLVRHHTYFNHQSSVTNNTESSVGCQSKSRRAVSLLTYSRELENSCPSDTDGVDALSASFNKSHCNPKCMSTWYYYLHLDSLSSMLSTILYQCIECLADSSWELRRMSSQLLPCIVEVIRWYDVSLLTTLCNEHFTGLKTSVLEYGIALAVKYSIQHASNLQQFMKGLAPQAQFTATNKKMIYHMISSIKFNRDAWSAAGLKVLSRSTGIDKLSVVAVEIIMMNQAYFSSSEKPNFETFNAVINTLINVFCKANSSHPLAADFVKMPSYVEMAIVSPSGFLSCSSNKVDVKSQLWTQQVEKMMYTDLRHVVIPFIQSSTCSQMTDMLPLLAAYINKYNSTDDALVRILIESVTVLCATVVKLLSENSASFNNENKLGTNALLGWRGLCSIISHKSSSVTILKQVLEICHDMIFVISLPTTCLSSLLQSICCKLNNEIPRETSEAYSNGATYVNLTLLSNDIRPVVTPGDDKLDILDDDDGDDVLGHSMHDMQLLSASAGSGSSLSPRVKVISTASSALDVKRRLKQRLSTTSWDSDSEDDWSDSEQQKPSEVREILRQFIQRIYASFQKKDLTVQLATSIRMLPEKDQRQLETIRVNQPLR